MESLLGFVEPPPLSENDVVEEGKTQQSFKFVPWISWAEWTFVHDSLFSPSPASVSSALQRIATWRSRGYVPVAVDVTASIIEIQQKDPFFRNELVDKVVQSEEMLAMLYCMAIMRLVNCVVEKTRKKHEVSIAQAADAIGLPRMLIDIRHEGSHRDLPSLQLVRLASTKALDWLKSYYWEPQRSAIPVQVDLTANLRKEIKQRLLELAFCLKAKQNSQSSSTPVKGKRFKHLELMGGRNKFMSFMAAKHPYSKSSGSKKHLTKTMKNVLRLYASYSSEVTSIILKILLKALDMSDLMEVTDSSDRQANDMQVVFDDWKAVIVKLSNKEPELLLTLLRAVLEKYETHENDKRERGEQLSSQNAAESRQIEQLCLLLECLVGVLGMSKLVRHKELEAETEVSRFNMPNATLSELLHKCLLACSHGDNQLMASALVLARMMGNSTLAQKLNKLSMLSVKDPDARFVLAPHTNSQSFFTQQEDSIHQAAKKLELIKLQRMRSNNVEPRDDHVEPKHRWTVVKSWNSCPIGMLPRTLGSSAGLVVLDFNDNNEEVPKTSTSKEQLEQNQSCAKRVADCDVESLDDSNVKKIRETTETCELYNDNNVVMEGVEGHLMIDGVWKRVRQEEVLAISSAVRILV